MSPATPHHPHRHPLDGPIRRVVDTLAVAVLTAITAVCFVEVVLRDVAAQSLI